MKGFSGFKESPMRITSIDYESQFGGGNPNLQVTNTTMAPEPEPEPAPEPEPEVVPTDTVRPGQRRGVMATGALRGGGTGNIFQGIMARRFRPAQFAPMSKKFGTKQGAFMLPEKSIIEK